MSFVTQEDVFAAIEPVMHGVFEEFADGKPVTPYPFPRIPYRESMRQVRHRQAGPAQPDRACRTSPSTSAAAASACSPRILGGRQERRLGASRRRTAARRAFCDRMNSWAQGEGQPGLGYIFWREDQGGWGGPIAKNLGPERDRRR